MSERYVMKCICHPESMPTYGKLFEDLNKQGMPIYLDEMHPKDYFTAVLSDGEKMEVRKTQ